MNLQEEILNQFDRHFPNATLKQVSKKTGIQITRVFRIINGYEMKISEYEKFYNALSAYENKNTCQHLSLYQDYLNSISSKQREELEEIYTQRVLFHSLRTPHIVLQNNDHSTMGGLQNA